MAASWAASRSAAMWWCSNFRSDNSTDFIKRVIGLPGDRIQMNNDVLYLNGKPVPRERVADYVGDLDGEEGHWTQYRETLPGGKSYVMLDKHTDGPLDNTEEFVVPPGHYFMMGDNRDNSDDSREAVGYVPAENLEGKALFRFFSTDGSARILGSLEMALRHPLFAHPYAGEVTGAGDMRPLAALENARIRFHDQRFSSARSPMPAPMPRAPTSGWNFWATGCWRWWWPKRSIASIPTKTKAR